jgi:hypothetical protein
MKGEGGCGAQRASRRRLRLSGSNDGGAACRRHDHLHGAVHEILRSTKMLRGALADVSRRKLPGSFWEPLQIPRSDQTTRSDDVLSPGIG